MHCNIRMNLFQIFENSLESGRLQRSFIFKTIQSIRKWIEFSKISTFFLPKTIYFFFEKLNILDRNFWFFSNNYLKIFNFYKTYKSIEIFGELYYLVEKFTVAEQGIFSGERPGHLNAIKRPRQGVRGEGPPNSSEVSLCKTIQSIWKWIHFSKMATFFVPKRSILSKKNLEKLNILQELLNFIE